MGVITENERKLNVTLTLIIELHEVMARLITDDIDNPTLKHMLKKEFKALFQCSKKVDREFRAYVKQDRRYDDPEELFDSGADLMYDLIRSTVGITDDKDWEILINKAKELAAKT